MKVIERENARIPYIFDELERTPEELKEREDAAAYAARL